jgi:hypothetical protein
MCDSICGEKQMDLNEIFDGIGKQMLLDFEHIQAQIKHAGERGSEREASLRTFLTSYLPSKYAIANGEIVDEQGQTSKQCDLVVYDHINCPLLLAGKDYRVFPAEPVFAAIEVKSVLNVAELRDASEKIRSVKSLVRSNGLIGGILFAYTSIWVTDPMQKAAEHLQEINHDLEPYQYIDLLCILDTGVITVIDREGYTRIPQDLSGRCMFVYHELTPPVLLWFFIHLLDLLDNQTCAVPNYQQYARMFDIGTVSRQDLAN